MTVETGAITLLSDGQVGALIAAVVSIATSAGLMVRFMFGRLVKALDDANAERAAHRVELGRLAVKVDDLHGWVLEEERGRAATPPQGSPYRPATQGR